jgi:hypothetical protein
MEEREAGAKQLRGESEVRNTIGRGQSYGFVQSNPFPKHLKRKYCCVLCDFNSYESDRKGEKLENFLHPEQTTDFGVLCTTAATSNAEYAWSNYIHSLAYQVTLIFDT